MKTRDKRQTVLLIEVQYADCVMFYHFNLFQLPSFFSLLSFLHLKFLILSLLSISFSLSLFATIFNLTSNTGNTQWMDGHNHMTLRILTTNYLFPNTLSYTYTPFLLFLPSSLSLKPLIPLHQTGLGLALFLPAELFRHSLAELYALNTLNSPKMTRNIQ